MGSLVLCLKERSYLERAVLGLSPFPTEQRTGSVCTMRGGAAHHWHHLPRAAFLQGKQPHTLNPGSIPASRQATNSCTCPLLRLLWGEHSPEQSHHTKGVRPA